MKLLRKKMKTALAVALIGMGTLVLNACLLNPVGDGLDSSGHLLSPNGDVQPLVLDTFTSLVQPIFTAHCIVCHSPGGAGYTATGGSNGGLDLTSGNAYASLVNHKTFEDSTTSPTLRVEPGSPSNSYIYQKISSTTPKSGSQMPLGGPYLSATDIATIQTWIQQGAKQ